MNLVFELVEVIINLSELVEVNSCGFIKINMEPSLLLLRLLMTTTATQAASVTLVVRRGQSHLHWLPRRTQAKILRLLII